MVNVNKLRGKIVENGMSVESVADTIGIDKSTFYRKLRDGGDTFLIKEVVAMIDILNLSRDDINAIFFAQAVA